jgi:O-antigen/teichoic acid export membrane protein
MNNSFLKNGLYNIIGGLVRIGLSILTTPVLIHLMGTANYGLWTIAYTIMMIVDLAEAGLSVTSTIFIAKDLEERNFEGISQTISIVVSCVIIFAIFSTISLYFCAEFVVDLFPKLSYSEQIAIKKTIQLSSFVIFLRLIQRPLVGIEQAFQNYKLLSLINTLQCCFLCLSMFIFSWLGGRLYELMQIHLFINILTLILHIQVIKNIFKGINIHFSINLQKAKTIIRHSIFIWLISLSGAIFLRCDRLIVASLLGPEALGFYAAITDAAGAINSFSALSIQPLVPIISGYIHEVKHSNIELKKQTRQALEMNVLVTSGLGILLFIFAEFVLSKILGLANTYENILAFKGIILIYSFYSLNTVGYFILISLDVKLCMIIQMISSLFSLILIGIGASSFKLLGAVFGNAGFILSISFIYFGMQKLNFPIKLWIQWIIYPILLFVFIVVIQSILPREFYLVNTTVSLTALMSLFWWFMRQNNIKVDSIIKSHSS